MTVKLLSEEQKALVAEKYLSKQLTQGQLAGLYNVSPRTIGRVIKEQENVVALSTSMWPDPLPDPVPHFTERFTFWQRTKALVRGLFI